MTGKFSMTRRFPAQATPMIMLSGSEQSTISLRSPTTHGCSICRPIRRKSNRHRRSVHPRKWQSVRITVLMPFPPFKATKRLGSRPKTAHICIAIPCVTNMVEESTTPHKTRSYRQQWTEVTGALNTPSQTSKSKSDLFSD